MTEFLLDTGERVILESDQDANLVRAYLVLQGAQIVDEHQDPPHQSLAFRATAGR